MPCFFMNIVLFVSINVIQSETLEYCRKNVFVDALGVVHTLSNHHLFSISSIPSEKHSTTQVRVM